MDGRRFDTLTRAFGQRGSRRTLLKGLLGLGGLTAAAVLHDTKAAQRGQSGPPTSLQLTGNETPARNLSLPREAARMSQVAVNAPGLDSPLQSFP